MTIRIAIIRQRYSPYGGAERFVESALNILRATNEIEVTLITRNWDNANNKNIRTILCNPFFLGRLWRDWSFAHQVCHILKEESFDIVQSHERIACCDIYRAGDGVHREWLRQRNKVIPFHKRLAIYLSPYHHYIKQQEKKLFTSNTLRAVITNSSQIKNEIIANFQTPANIIHIIHNAVDNKRYSPRLIKEFRGPIRQQLKIPSNAKVLLFVGSGFERKGVHILLQLINILPANIYLIIVGKDKKEKQLKKRYNSQRVRFMGPQKDVRPFYAASDLFLFPTLYDPLPNVVLEAMACGLPVLISSSCGATDLVKNGANGFVQSLDDIELWKQNTMNALSPEMYNTISINAKEITSNLTHDRMSQQLSSLYQEILESNYP